MWRGLLFPWERRRVSNLSRRKGTGKRAHTPYAVRPRACACSRTSSRTHATDVLTLAFRSRSRALTLSSWLTVGRTARGCWTGSSLQLRARAASPAPPGITRNTTWRRTAARALRRAGGRKSAKSAQKSAKSERPATRRWLKEAVWHSEGEMAAWAAAARLS